MIPLLDDPAVEVRIAASWAAGEVHEAAAIEPLCANLEHPHAGLRLATVRALVRMSSRNPETLLLLRPAEHDPLQVIREEVKDALQEGQGRRSGPARRD